MSVRLDHATPRLHSHHDWPDHALASYCRQSRYPGVGPRNVPVAYHRRPEDLRHHVLLHDDDQTGWRLWLELAGVEDVDAGRGSIFTDSAIVVQAAAEGQGVALARTALAAWDIAAGRLVRPFNVSMPHDLAYYLVCPEASAERPRIAAVRTWLLAEAAQYERDLEDLARPSVLRP